MFAVVVLMVTGGVRHLFLLLTTEKDAGIAGRVAETRWTTAALRLCGSA
jgi:hypothetical protein